MIRARHISEFLGYRLSAIGYRLSDGVLVPIDGGEFGFGTGAAAGRQHPHSFVSR